MLDHIHLKIGQSRSELPKLKDKREKNMSILLIAIQTKRDIKV